MPAILKVNQAGSLFDALEFANVANQNNIKLITSHRSGESTDSQISHIGIATKSKMLKVGVVGGERVAKFKTNCYGYQGMILYVAWQRFKIVMSEQTEAIDIKKKVDFNRDQSGNSS